MGLIPTFEFNPEQRPRLVSIIIPVYNESRYIEQIISKILAVELPGGLEKELIIVDDGSSDQTVDILETYKGTPSVIVHSSKLNFGKGTAIRIGLQYAKGDVILIQDGDLEYDPMDYGTLLIPFLEQKALVVYGTRFWRRVEGIRFRYRLAQKVLTWTANALYFARITDQATGYKVFAADLMRSIPLKCRRFEFCAEITAKVRKRGIEITERPISYNPRGIAQGKKIRWIDGIHAIWTLVKYRFVD